MRRVPVVLKHLKMLLIAITATLLQLVLGKEISKLSIVNGSDATEGEFPYAVSLRYKDQHTCGGSIIGEYWVLTAAHCIYPSLISSLTILYGTINLNNGVDPSPQYVVNASYAKRHDNFQDYGGFLNDIAVIKVESPFPFGDDTKAVKLPTAQGSVPYTGKFTLVGWGGTNGENKYVDILQKVEVEVFKNDYCQDRLPDYNSTYHICAGVKTDGKGQCTGDSGGPLTYEGIQFGIVSWSDKPCASKPGVLTNILSYRDWIFKETSI